MMWLILLVILIVGYYFIIKSKSKNVEKCFSLFSLVLFMLTTASFWNNKLFDFIIDISLFLPFVLGVLGVIFGWFGIKGNVRISLIGINILALFFYLIVFLMGTVGFQEP